MRKRVKGKRLGYEANLIKTIAQQYGHKESTVMSYWKDAVKANPDAPLSKIDNEVRKMIEDDLGDLK